MTENWRGLLASKGHTCTCRRCTENIKLGETVISNSGGGRYWIYHRECWEEMLH